MSAAPKGNAPFYCFTSTSSFFHGAYCASSMAACQKESAEDRYSPVTVACSAKPAAFCYASMASSGAVTGWTCRSDETDCRETRARHERSNKGYGTTVSPGCTKYTSKPAEMD